MHEGRARGALLGLAVGDALGTTLEFERPELERPWRLLDGPHRDIRGGGPFSVEPGQTTDDTQMAACLAASLAIHGGFVRDDVVRAYLEWEPHAFDIGQLTAASLARAREGANAARRVWETSGRQSAGNGSLTRTAPIGVLLADDPEERRAASLTESAITHFDPRCQLACASFNAALACAIASPDPPISGSAMHEAALLEVGTAAELLRDRHPELMFAIDAAESALTHDLHLATRDDPDLWDLIHAAQGFVRVSFRLAFWHLLHAPSFESALVDAVNRGGDADTNAAITGALIGAQRGVEAIPTRWSDPVLAALSDRAGHPLRDYYHPRVLLACLRMNGVHRDDAEAFEGDEEPTAVRGTGTSSDPFLSYDPDRQRRLVWDELICKGPLPWDEAIRTAAFGLRDKGLLTFSRLQDTSPAYEVIRGLIDAELHAELPLFDRGERARGLVRAIVSGPDAISRDCWRDFLLAVIGPSPIERDEAVRLAAERARSQVGLSFHRLRGDGAIATAIQAAINGAVRRGYLTHVSADLIARTDQPAPGAPSGESGWDDELTDSVD
jgi:ADP-ribosyl-[dinitrogen reductase] hydrolase